LASEQELGQLFPECELGAMPPLGVLFHLPVIVDASISEQEFIAFNAGTHLDVIHMSYGDYAHLVDPAVGKFTFMAMEQVAR
jgi:Ala-tRNA(Pro) deacylase